MGPSRSAESALETHPTEYRHWRLAVEPPLVILTLAVAEDSPVVPSYKLKLNSYDLGVDIELADAVTRLRFEHPEVRAVVVTGGLDRVFCAGANIRVPALHRRIQRHDCGRRLRTGAGLPGNLPWTIAAPRGRCLSRSGVTSICENRSRVTRCKTLSLTRNAMVAALRSRRGASYQLIRSIGQGNWRPNISVALAL